MTNIELLSIKLLGDAGFPYRARYDRRRLANVVEFIEDEGYLDVEIRTSTGMNQVPGGTKYFDSYKRVGAVLGNVTKFIWVGIPKQKKRRYLI